MIKASENQGSMFKNYMLKINQNQKFLAAIRTILPVDTAECLADCVIFSRRVVLYATQKSDIEKLRLYAPQVFQFLKPESLLNLERIEFKLIESEQERFSRDNEASLKQFERNKAEASKLKEHFADILGR